MPIDTTVLRDQIHSLLAEERAAWSQSTPIQTLLKLYLAGGGDANRLKQLVVLGAELRTSEKLNREDLPGPDNIWVPIILKLIRENAAELVDDLLSGRSMIDG